MAKSPFRAQLLDWMARFWAVRGLGGAPDAMMVASGQAEVWIEPSASPWDFAPLKMILEEAGARYLNVDGGSTIYAGNGIGCAPGLEARSPALSPYVSIFVIEILTGFLREFQLEVRLQV